MSAVEHEMIEDSLQENYSVDDELSLREGACLSATAIREILSCRWEDIDVRCFHIVDSTNSEARRLISVENKTYLVAASAQKAGRGRRGRSFYSPGDGCGLYFSLAVPWTYEAMPTQVTTMTAVAVCRALETLYDMTPHIKWVNDIFLHGRKVGGILTESWIRPETQSIEALIVGVGINLTQPKDGYPQAIADIAGTLSDGLSDPSAQKINPNELCAVIVDMLGAIIDALPDLSYMDDYRQRCFILGKKVLLDDGRVVIPSTVTDDGALVVEDNGCYEKLSTGEIKSIRLDI